MGNCTLYITIKEEEEEEEEEMKRSRRDLE